MSWLSSNVKLGDVISTCLVARSEIIHGFSMFTMIDRSILLFLYSLLHVYLYIRSENCIVGD